MGHDKHTQTKRAHEKKTLEKKHICNGEYKHELRVLSTFK